MAASRSISALFNPSGGHLEGALLACPDHLFASAIAGRSLSKRPLPTLTPLAADLTKVIETPWAKGQETELAAEVLNRPGAVLIAWEHKHVPSLAHAIVGEDFDVPANWPDDRFDPNGRVSTLALKVLG